MLVRPSGCCRSPRFAASAGMSAGLQDYVTINLSTLASAFGADEVVTIGALQEKRILNLSGREAKLPLKVRFWVQRSRW